MKKSVQVRGRFIALVIAVIFSGGCSKNDVKPIDNSQTATDKSATSMVMASTLSVSESRNTPTGDDAFDRAINRVIDQMLREMRNVPMSGDPDIDFARMMIKHHEGGIRMAELALQYGHHTEGKALAQKTKDGNARSKARLEAFLQSHPHPEKISQAEYRHFMEDIENVMNRMRSGFQQAPDTDDVDVDFSELMIIHHQGAFGMASTELKFGDDQKTLDEAKTIINEQAMEMIEFSEFVNKHGAPIKNDDHGDHN